VAVKYNQVGVAIALRNARNKEFKMWIDPKLLMKQLLRQVLIALLIPCAFIGYTALCIYIGRAMG
jgi:hypothetical protein